MAEGEIVAVSLDDAAAKLRDQIRSAIISTVQALAQDAASRLFNSMR